MNSHSPWHNRNVVVMSSSVGILLFLYFSWQRVLPLILQDLGASEFQISIAYGVVALTMGIMQYPGGLLADRFGRKPLIVMPNLLIGLLYFAGAWAQDWRLLMAVVALTNGLTALQTPSFMALLAESVVERKRGAVYAILELWASLGLAAGPALGAWLLPAYSYRPLMAVTGIACVIMSLVRHIGLRETRTAPPSTAGRSTALLPHFDRPLQLLLLISVTTTLVSSLLIFGPFISLYASNQLGFSTSQINLMFSFGTLGGIGLCLVAGRLTERYGSARILRWGALGHAITMMLWLTLPSFLLACLCFALSYACFQLAWIAHSALRADVAPDHARAGVLGIIGSAAQMAGAAGLPLAGLAETRFGSQAPFAIALALTLLLWSLTITLHRHMGTRRDPAITALQA